MASFSNEFIYNIFVFKLFTPVIAIIVLNIKDPSLSISQPFTKTPLLSLHSLAIFLIKLNCPLVDCLTLYLCSSGIIGKLARFHDFHSSLRSEERRVGEESLY